MTSLSCDCYRLLRNSWGPLSCHCGGSPESGLVQLSLCEVSGPKDEDPPEFSVWCQEQQWSCHRTPAAGQTSGDGVINQTVHECNTPTMNISVLQSWSFYFGGSHQQKSFFSWICLVLAEACVWFTGEEHEENMQVLVSGGYEPADRRASGNGPQRKGSSRHHPEPGGLEEQNQQSVGSSRGGATLSWWRLYDEDSMNDWVNHRKWVQRSGHVTLLADGEADRTMCRAWFCRRVDDLRNEGERWRVSERSPRLLFLNFMETGKLQLLQFLQKPLEAGSDFWSFVVFVDFWLFQKTLEGPPVSCLLGGVVFWLTGWQLGESNKRNGQTLVWPAQLQFQEHCWEEGGANGTSCVRPSSGFNFCSSESSPVIILLKEKAKRSGLILLVL